MSDFPVLDALRTHANSDFGRMILDAFGDVEAYLEETDSWIAMPVRLVYDDAAGWHLELGPYSMDVCDINVLRAAIASYDAATAPDASGALPDNGILWQIIQRQLIETQGLGAHGEWLRKTKADMERSGREWTQENFVRYCRIREFELSSRGLST
jgi:hypothetical protein